MFIRLSVTLQEMVIVGIRPKHKTLKVVLTQNEQVVSIELPQMVILLILAS